MLPNFAARFEGEVHQPFHWELGEDAALLIHGYPGTSAEMRPVAKILHQSGWTVRGMLLPGFGNEIATLAAKRHGDWQMAVESELVSLQQYYKRVLLVGYSMGGALAINAAAKYRVDGLILFSPFVEVQHILWKALPVIRLAFPKVKIFRLMKPNFADPQTREGIRNFMPDADLDAPEVQAAILNFELPVAMFNEIRTLGQKAQKAASSIRVPSLVFQGLQDELVKAEGSRKLVQKMKGHVEYQEIDAPHEILNPVLEGWSTVETRVHNYLARLE
jgi:esterase/lipase